MAIMTHSEMVGQDASPCMVCMVHPGNCHRCTVHAVWLETRKIAIKDSLAETTKMINRIMRKHGMR